METMEPGCYEESCAVDAIGDCEGSFVILEGLEKGEIESQEDG